jgi:phage shock protein PspC (stress-responsive transcriptional regulator)
MRKLCRTVGNEAKLCGVCGGLAKYFDLDPTIVRLIVAALILFAGLSLWFYIIAALIMPRENEVQ